MTPLPAVLLCTWFAMTAWSQTINDRVIARSMQSPRFADFPYNNTRQRPTKDRSGAQQQRSPRQRPFRADWKSTSHTVKRQSAGAGAQSPLFLDKSAPQYDTGSYPTYLAIADFNGDGVADLAATYIPSCLPEGCTGSVSVLLGNSDGTFQTHVDYVTGNYPTSVEVGDFNGDAFPDLAVTNCNDNSVCVLLGNGDGTFQSHMDYAVGTDPNSVAVGDFNRDGEADLAVINGSDNSVSVLLGNGNGTFQTHLDYATGKYPSWVAVGDFNSDGKADLAVTNSGDISNDLYTNSVSVLLGNGNGTFQTHVDHETGEYPTSVAVGDFNSDGHADLTVTNGMSNSLSVLLGNGDGTFQLHVDYETADLDVQTASDPSSVVVGDVNNDGKPDLAVVNPYHNSVSVLLGNGNGTFQTHVEYATGTGPASIVVGDFNGDSQTDLAVTNYYDNSVSVLLGNGDGTLQGPPSYETGADPISMAAADFNGDGNSDLVTTNVMANSVSVLLGNRDGSFKLHADYATGNYPTSVAIADFNGDGRADLAVTNATDSSVSLLLGNGNGIFQKHVDYATGEWPTGVAVGDFNGDGKPDLAVANHGENSVSELLGTGDGTFQPHVDYQTVDNPWPVAVGDFNCDGKMDLVVPSWRSSAVNTWLGLVSVLLGNGDGTFQTHMEYATGNAPVSVAVGDLNSDGKPDLAVANYSSVSVLLGNGDGTFQRHLDFPTELTPTSLSIRDFNGDAKADLAVTNSLGPVRVLLGNGDGTFRAGLDYARGQGNAAATAVDLNHDGAIDIAFITPRNAVSTLLNIAAKDFALTATPATDSLKSGSSLDFDIRFSATNGFVGPVSLSCSVLPTPAFAPTCAVNPQSVTLTSNGSATAKLTITTTAPTASLYPQRGSRLWYALCLPVFGLALLGAGSGRCGEKKILTGLLLLFFLASVSLPLACGGSGGGDSGNTHTGTPPGEYQVTVAANSGSLAHSTVVTITVQ